MNQYKFKKIAIIDVDGTLLSGQIQQKLIIFFWKRHQISFWYFLKLNMWFILYKLGICKDTRSILNYGIKYLNGKTIDSIAVLINEFMDLEVGKSIFPNSRRLLDNLRTDGYTIVILSSAIDIVINRIAKMFNADDCICTQTEKNNGVYTGKICGNIMYGNGKVIAIKQYFLLNNYSIETAVAYADHESDIPMLKIVGRAFIVNPSRYMMDLAKKESLNIAYTA
jgi:HAD superfamily hydrolase (TIGR01490 family)